MQLITFRWSSADPALFGTVQGQERCVWAFGWFLTDPLAPPLPHQPKPENAVTIAVSSRVLFRTEKEDMVFRDKGVEEYLKYQVEHEMEPFAPGPAFPFIKVTDVHACSRTPAHSPQPVGSINR